MHLQQSWVVAVPQERVADHASLLRRLDRVVRAGGEGLMLHRGDSFYRAERNDDLLKVKTHEDAEARVAQAEAALQAGRLDQAVAAHSPGCAASLGKPAVHHIPTGDVQRSGQL